MLLLLFNPCKVKVSRDVPFVLITLKSARTTSPILSRKRTLSRNKCHRIPSHFLSFPAYVTPFLYYHNHAFIYIHTLETHLCNASLKENLTSYVFPCQATSNFLSWELALGSFYVVGWVVCVCVFVLVSPFQYPSLCVLGKKP